MSGPMSVCGSSCTGWRPYPSPAARRGFSGVHSLTVLLTVIGLAALLGPAAMAPLGGQTFAEAFSDGGQLGWAFIVVRLAHIACVMVASVLMFTPCANAYFAVTGRLACRASLRIPEEWQHEHRFRLPGCATHLGSVARVGRSLRLHGVSPSWQVGSLDPARYLTRALVQLRRQPPLRRAARSAATRLRQGHHTL